MAGEWTLNIDLLQSPGRAAVVFSLLNPGRSQSWNLVNTFLPGICQNLVSHISEFFSPTDGLPPQQEFESFRLLAEATFDLEGLLRRANVSQNEMLAVSTLATGIPWDLLPFEGGSLGELLNIGLTVPAPPALRLRPRVLDGGSARPQFLHVIANPRGDLYSAAEEAEAIRSLVQQQGELDYEYIADPTPDDLAGKLGTCRRPTPFFHFTGHIAPAEGLELKGGILGYEDITRFFPGSSDQIVMLNGCDALWERGPSSGDGDSTLSPSAGRPRSTDMFQTAGVARAFLDAGVGAVIAPRSSIRDQDAMRAAKLAWERVFAGDGLGNVVRQIRHRLSESDCAVQSRHSYILYGAPSARIRLRTPPVSPQGENIQYGDNEEIFLEACGDAGGAAEPRHIFAALSRRWIVGQAYFEREGNKYIETLESLRESLRVSAAPQPAKRVELSRASQRMLESVVDRPREPRAIELNLLESLAAINDLEVQCALEGVHRGPRRLDQLLQLARDWSAAGGKSEMAAFNPDGFANFAVLLPNVFGRGPAPLRHEKVEPHSVDVWDFFVALIHAGGKVAETWKKCGASSSAMPVPPAGAWQLAHALHWSSLTEPLQKVMTRAFAMSLAENAETVGEGHVAYQMVSENGFFWEDLPSQARTWLTSNAMNAKQWAEFDSRLRTECLGWF